MKKPVMIVVGPLASSGAIDTAYETPSYANALGSGDRPLLNTKFTTSGAAMWSVINPLVEGHHDGITNNNMGYTNDGVPVAGEWYKWDFTTLHMVTEIKIYFNTAGAACGIWRPVGWDGLTIEAVGPNFELGTGLASLVQTIDASNHTKGYTAYGIQGVSGVSSYNLYYWSEIEFKIGAHL